VSGVLCSRLLRFSLVGALGVVVQLGALAVLSALRCEYLLATSLAVESAVLHNFVWHRRFTWRDRRQLRKGELFRALFRFHLSNGFVSLLGNLLMMRVLVGSLRLPLLAANLTSIVMCFIVNFVASDRWVFRS
jgi:dolichol-phosphate mannosyltransferase